MKNKPVTLRERELIKEWTRERNMEQGQIAAKLGLSRVKVYQIQRELGVRQHVPNRQPLPERTERKIIQMLRQNVARVRIARELGVSPERIHPIAKRIRFRRRRGAVGIAYRLRKPEIARIREAVTQSEQAICKKFHVSRWWLRRFRVGSFTRKRK